MVKFGGLSLNQPLNSAASWLLPTMRTIYGEYGSKMIQRSSRDPILQGVKSLKPILGVSLQHGPRLIASQISKPPAVLIAVFLVVTRRMKCWLVCRPFVHHLAGSYAMCYVHKLVVNLKKNNVLLATKSTLFHHLDDQLPSGKLT